MIADIAAGGQATLRLEGLHEREGGLSWWSRCALRSFNSLARSAVVKTRWSCSTSADLSVRLQSDLHCMVLANTLLVKLLKPFIRSTERENL